MSARGDREDDACAGDSDDREIIVLAATTATTVKIENLLVRNVIPPLRAGLTARSLTQGRFDFPSPSRMR
jgi:hypothetical protein